MYGLLFVHLANYEFRKMIADAALLQMTYESGSLPPKGMLGRYGHKTLENIFKIMVATVLEI